MALTGKTGRRVVTLSTAAAAFFAEQTTGKIANAPILATAFGRAWSKDTWKKPFKEAVKAAELPCTVVMYSLRHTAISGLIAGGMDSFIVARLAGTSTEMIDKHYEHLRQDRTRAKLDASTAGSATNSNVTYLIGGTNTQPGSYAVNITQAATEGTFTGSSAPTLDSATGSIALSGPTTIAAGTTLTLTIGGTATTVNLTAVTYTTPADVATMLPSAITASGASATATQNNGVPSLTPAGGCGQAISVSDGTSSGATQLFGASSVANNSTTIPSGGLPLTLTMDGTQASVTLGAVI